MRLEITLAPKDNYFKIPINYNYPVSAELNRIFANGDYDFSNWLPDNRCRFREDKADKMFTFSRLINPSLHIDNDILSGYGSCKLYFSSSVDEDDIEDFAGSLLKSEKIVLKGRNTGMEFRINNVRNIPEPSFKREEVYFMLSPTTLSKVGLLNGVKSEHFIRALDNDTPSMLAFNLRKKFEAVHMRPYDGSLKIELDKNYILERGGNEGISKLVTIKENSDKEIRVKGFLCPVKITAEPEMQKVAFDCGLGERNHFGFGMLDRELKRSSVKIGYN